MNKLFVGLHDAEFEHIKGKSFPNYALMKISAWHKQQGGKVEMFIPIDPNAPEQAHVAPRSSTYKHFKIILANSMGVIDNCYCGNNDQWNFPAIALEDTVIHKNDRICQFRIVKKQPPIEFETVEKLGDVDRGGLGSTGKR